MNNNARPGDDSRPVATVRDGSIKGSAWRNESTKNPGEHYFSVRITRTYKDRAGAFQDSDRFMGSELLRVARLAQRMYDRVVDLQDDERQGRRDGERDVSVDYDADAEPQPGSMRDDGVPF